MLMHAASIAVRRQRPSPARTTLPGRHRRTTSICSGIALMVFLSTCGPTREFERIDENWQIMWEHSPISEAGNLHPFLWRKSLMVQVIVDRDTYEYKAVGDDCVVWIGLDSRGLYIACGDRQPILMSPAQFACNLKIDGDTVTISEFQKPYFAGSLVDWKARSLKQPRLTNSWQATALRAY